MKYVELPSDHDWNNFRYVFGYKTSTCMKCKQLLFFLMNEGAWYVENRELATSALINRESQIIDCEEMQNQTKMNEALS